MERVSIDSCGTVLLPPGSRLSERVLEDYEFVYIKRGSIRWEVDGVLHALAAPALLLGKRGSRERYEWDPALSTYHDYVHFMALDLQLEAQLALAPLFISLQDGALVQGLFDQIRSCALGDRALEYLIFCYCHDMVDVRPKLLPREHPVLSRVHSYLCTVWGDGVFSQLSLAEICDAAGMSASQLNRIFQSCFNMSSVQTIRALRLERAATLLRNAENTLVEIARLSGFATVQHFSREFKKYFGLPPVAYRRGDKGGRGDSEIRGWLAAFL